LYSEQAGLAGHLYLPDAYEPG